MVGHGGNRCHLCNRSTIPRIRYCRLSWEFTEFEWRAMRQSLSPGNTSLSTRCTV